MVKLTKEFNLSEKLKKYSAFDRVEEENVKKVLEFLKTSENSYSRENLSGHITCGALVIDKDFNILLNHHLLSGNWFQFGGHSDSEKDSRSVALREVKEESGIDDVELIMDKILDVDVQEIPHNEKKREPAHFHYDINFLVIAHDKNFTVSNESKELKWVSIKEARKLINGDRALIRMLKKVEALQKQKSFELGK